MKKLFIIVSCLLAFQACEQPDWNDPVYVNKLISESDAAECRLALNKLGSQSDELKSKVVPALITVYNKKGANQKKAMSLLVEIRSMDAKAVYLDELKTNTTGYAAASAAALGDAKVTDAIPELIKMLASTPNPDSKVGIIQALGKMPDPKSVQPLMDILKLDVDNNPIKVHSYACDVLGDIALQHPDAFTDANIKQITLSVFFGNNIGQSLDQPCGLAIQKIGKRAIPHLLSIFKGERDDIKKLMLKYDTPKDPFPSNAPKLIAAKRLTSLRSQEAVDLFIADLKSTKEAPQSLKGNAAVHWRVKEGQITSEIIRSLGDLKSPKALPVLAGIVSGEYVTKEWDDITDGMVELQLRQEAAYSLNQIGDRKQDAVLLKMGDEGVVIDFEKRAAIISRTKKVKDLERYQFNWMMVYSYAMLNDGSGVKSLQTLADKNKAKFPELAKKMESFIPVIDVATQCSAKADDGAKAKCFSVKLKDATPYVREKAVWEIARLSPDLARTTLIANLGTSFLDTREIITSSLYAFANKDVAKAAKDLIEKEKSKGGKSFKLSRLRLKLLHAFASHN